MKVNDLNQSVTNKPIDALLGEVGFIERKGTSGVLLVHGLTGTPTEMKQFGKTIARQGFTVACPALAGHCDSIEALSATKWIDWYQSIEVAFDALKQECEHVFIAGLSMGALIALLVAAKKKDQVAGVILLSTTFFMMVGTFLILSKNSYCQLCCILL